MTRNKMRTNCKKKKENKGKHRMIHVILWAYKTNRLHAIAHRNLIILLCYLLTLKRLEKLTKAGYVFNVLKIY